jgi:uncharacterized membrane protein
MQQRHQGLHSDINTPQIDSFAPAHYQRFRRRFFVALFIGLVGLIGFMIVLATILYG